MQQNYAKIPNFQIFVATNFKEPNKTSIPTDGHNALSDTKITNITSTFSHLPHIFSQFFPPSAIFPP